MTAPETPLSELRHVSFSIHFLFHATTASVRGHAGGRSCACWCARFLKLYFFAQCFHRRIFEVETTADCLEEQAAHARGHPWRRILRRWHTCCCLITLCGG